MTPITEFLEASLSNCNRKIQTRTENIIRYVAAGKTSKATAGLRITYSSIWRLSLVNESIAEYLIMPLGKSSGSHNTLTLT